MDDANRAQSPIFELSTTLHLILTEYFALVASSSPSLSQLIIGFGFPWAEQLSRVLPPSFASTYCGGVAVNEGGAVKKVKAGVIYVRNYSNLSQRLANRDFFMF